MLGTRATLSFRLTKHHDEWRVHGVLVSWPETGQPSKRTAVPDIPRFPKVLHVATALAFLSWRELANKDCREQVTPVLEGPRGTREGDIARSVGELLCDAKRRKVKWLGRLFGNPAWTKAQRSAIETEDTALHAFLRTAGSQKHWSVALNEDYLRPSDLSFIIEGFEDERAGLECFLRSAKFIAPELSGAVSATPSLPQSTAGDPVDDEDGQVRAFIQSLQSRLGRPHMFMQGHHQDWHNDECKLYILRRLIGQNPRQPEEPAAAKACDDPLLPGLSPYVRREISQQDDLLRSILQPGAFDRVCIVGAAGAGKSTFLENMAARLSMLYLNGKNHVPLPIPCLIDLSAWQTAQSFENLVSRSIGQQGVKSKKLFWDLCEKSKVVFLLDGFDEIRPAPIRREAAKQLNRVHESKPFDQCSVLLTSRPWAIEGTDLRAFRAHTLRLEPFDLAEIEDYVQMYFRNQPERTNSLVHRLRDFPATQRLVRNPHFLVMLCFLSASDDISFPGTEEDLLNAALRQLLRRREGQFDAEAENCSPTGEETAFRLLAHLAWSCWSGGSGRLISEGKAQKVVLNSLTRDEILRAELHGEKPSAVIQHLARYSGILVRASSGQYKFAEQTFVEHLAGCWLAEQDELRTLEIFARHAWDPTWDRVLKSMMQQLGRGDKRRQQLAVRMLEWLLAEHEHGHDDRWGTLRLNAARYCGMLARQPDQTTTGLVERTMRAAFRAFLQDVRWFTRESLFCSQPTEGVKTLVSLVRPLVADCGPAIERGAPRGLRRILEVLLRSAPSAEAATTAATVFRLIDPALPNDILCEIVTSRANLAIRMAAADALADFPSEKSRLALVTVLTNPMEQTPVREQAAVALLRNWGNRAIAILIEIAMREDWIPTTALQLTRRTNFPAIESAIRDLTTILADPLSSDKSRAKCASILGVIGSHTALDAIIRCLNSPPDANAWLHRSMAVRALKHAYRDPRSAHVLLRVIQDTRENLMVRYGAILSLGTLGAESAVPVLRTILTQPEKLFGDPSSWYGAAITVLNLLSEYVYEGCEDIAVFRAAAALALGEIGTPESIQALANIIGDQDECDGVRAAAR